MKLTTNPRLAGLLLALVSLQALAAGDTNMLIKPKDLKPAEGYVLFSMLYRKSDLAGGDVPCLQVELSLVGAKKKHQYLNTTRGWKCNTAWTNPEAVAEKDGVMRVVILQILPAGEYEVGGGYVQYNRSTMLMTSHPPVLGFGRLQVTAGKLSYAGAFWLMQSSGKVLYAAGSLWENDSVLLKKLRPDLDSGDVIMATWTDPPAR